MKELDCCFEKENNWFRYRAAAIIIEGDYVLFAKNEKTDYYYSVGGGVHMNEISKEAVERETLEETGVPYKVDRLAFIHENFFEGDGSFTHGKKHCHEIAFYYLMKPKGNKELNSNSYSKGIKENMYWIPIDELDKYKAYPTFFKDKLKNLKDEVEHIVTVEK